MGFVRFFQHLEDLLHIPVKLLRLRWEGKSVVTTLVPEAILKVLWHKVSLAITSDCLKPSCEEGWNHKCQSPQCLEFEKLTKTRQTTNNNTITSLVMIFFRLKNLHREIQESSRNSAFPYSFLRSKMKVSTYSSRSKVLLKYWIPYHINIGHIHTAHVQWLSPSSRYVIHLNYL